MRHSTSARVYTVREDDESPRIAFTTSGETLPPSGHTEGAAAKGSTPACRP